MDSIISHHKEDVIKLCKSLEIESLCVFGSAATNSLNDTSDIDFFISFSDSLSPEAYSNSYFVIHQALQDLFKREIDLVTKNSLFIPYFIESIDETKVLIYAKEDQKVSV